MLSMTGFFLIVIGFGLIVYHQVERNKYVPREYQGLLSEEINPDGSVHQSSFTPLINGTEINSIATNTKIRVRPIFKGPYVQIADQ